MFKGRTRLCVLCDCINSHRQTDSRRREEWEVGGVDKAAVSKGISLKNGLVARNKTPLARVEMGSVDGVGELRKHERKVRLTSWELESSLGAPHFLTCSLTSWVCQPHSSFLTGCFFPRPLSYDLGLDEDCGCHGTQESSTSPQP